MYPLITINANISSTSISGYASILLPLKIMSETRVPKSKRFHISTFPEPEFDMKRAAIYSTIFVIGIIIFTFAFFWMPPAEFSNSGSKTIIENSLPQISTNLDNNLRWIEVRNKTIFTELLVAGVGITLATVASFEILKFLIEYFLYFVTFGNKFDRFFGDGASRHSRDGIILLQSDKTQDLFVDPKAEEELKPKIYSHSRCFKARHWVNRWDMEGARRIRDCFLKEGLQAPSLHPADHEERNEGNVVNDAPFVITKPAWKEAPFIIAMGLGFTELTDHLTENLPWLKIEKQSPCGDLIQLWHRFLRENTPGLQPKNHLQVPHFILGSNSYEYAPGEKRDLVRILPDPNPGQNTWDIETWSKTASACSDYGIILRRTYIVPKTKKRKVFLVVAGFTEIGTAIAADYLANKWEYLEADFVGKNKSKKNNYGDFLIVITGKSNLEQAHTWERSIQLTPPQVNEEWRQHADTEGWPSLSFVKKSTSCVQQNE